MTKSSSLRSSPDLCQSLKRTIPGSPGLMLFPKEGGCVLYNPKEGKIEKNLGDFPGCRFLANSGNWFLVLDSGSNLSIVDVFSKETIPLPSLESIESADSTVKRVGDTDIFERHDSDCFFRNLSADVVRGLLWVSESGKEYVVVWLFDLPGHSYISFCKNGDTHYTDIPLFHHRDLDMHWLDGLSEMVLQGTRLYVTTNRRYVRVFDLSGPQGLFKDITDGIPFPMLSSMYACDSSIAVTSSGEVLLVESQPWERSWFRLYKKDLDVKNPLSACHTVTEIDSLGGEALLLDLGFTVPANKALGIEPDSIYFTRHNRPCQCDRRDLDICAYNLVTKSFHRVPGLDKMDLIDALWFLPSGN